MATKRSRLLRATWMQHESQLLRSAAIGYSANMGLKEHEEFIARELAAHKCKWEAGSFPDLIKAFLLCTGNDHPLQGWISDAVVKELTAALNSGTTSSRKRGQGAPRAAYKNNSVHHLRWSCAQHWLNNRKALPGLGLYSATRDGAFAYASELLRGTIARGAPVAVEESFKAVEKSIKRGDDVWFDEG